MKPDRVGLWVYELCVKLNNKASYMLDLWLHDAIGNLGEFIPVSKVVRHWGKVVHSFNTARKADTIFVFDSYYMDDAAREGLAAKKIKFIGAVNPQRFPTLTRVVREGVNLQGMWKGLWNERRKELIVYSYTKDGKQYTALSNAYRRLATKSDTKSVPLCSDMVRCLPHVINLIARLKIGYGHIGMVVEGAWASRGSSVLSRSDVCCKTLLMLIVTSMQ